MLVEEILHRKGHEVITIRPTASVAEAVRRLSLEKVGALVVSDDGAHLEGIISERDVIRHLARAGVRLLEQRVSDVMTRSVPTCAPDDRLKTVMAQMTEARARHMPVLHEGKLHGLVSIGDIVKQRLDDLELKSAVMHDVYIMQRASKGA